MKTIPVRSWAIAALLVMLVSGVGLGKLLWPNLSARSQAILGASGQLVAWAALGVMAVLVEKERAVHPPIEAHRDVVTPVTGAPHSAP
jgi:hypothetical protein